MKAFLDSGFLLTLLLKTSGSRKAWEIVRHLNEPLFLAKLQILNTENRLQREIEADDSTAGQRAVAANDLTKRLELCPAVLRRGLPPCRAGDMIWVLSMIKCWRKIIRTAFVRRFARHRVENKDERGGHSF